MPTMGLHDQPDTQYEHVACPTIGATDASAYVGIWSAPFKCKIITIEMVNTAVVTGANTNSRNLNIQLQDGATEIANIDFVSGTNATALARTALTLTGTAAQLTLAAGDVLVIQSEKVGTGLAGSISPYNIKFGFQGA